MLCSHCTTIFSGTRQFNDEERDARFQHEEYPHHPSLKSLLQSAKDGCHFCVWIANDFTPADGTVEREGCEKWLLHMRGIPLSTEEFSFKYSILRNSCADDTKPKDVKEVFKICFWSVGIHVVYIYRIDEDVDVSLTQPDTATDEEDQSVNGTTGSNSAWRVAKFWVADCVERHETCSNLWDPEFLPTRLIDVGDGSEDVVRLCEVPRISAFNTAHQRTRYMTLSHSWGKKKFKTLLKSNLEEFKNAIHMKSLTKTFQDAITMTRRYSIRYLWIDSLCIIQDCEKDWEKESATMADVYENTYLNIAATAAKNGDDGCFFIRNPLSVEHYIATVYTELVSDLNYLPLGRYACRNSLAWSRSVEESPLGRRAWVVQERFLAPRTLHFGAQQLFWECCEKQFCEAHSDWSQQQFASNLKNNASLEAGVWTREPEVTITSERKARLFELWKDVVFAYTSCDLSFDTDKLIAFSAIAMTFQRRLGSKYLAGMFREDLIYQLLWRSLRPVERSIDYCAPTWSWASTKSVVLNASNRRDQNVGNTLATVEDVGVWYATDNCLGPLKSGVLWMRGFLVEGNLAVDGTDGKRRVKVAGLTELIEFDPDIVLSKDGWPLKVYLLPIKGSFPGGGDENNVEICGLVLRLMNEKGEFTRLGRFDIGTVRHATQDVGSCALLMEKNDKILELDEVENGVRIYAMPDGPVRGQEWEWEWRQFRIAIV